MSSKMYWDQVFRRIQGTGVVRQISWLQKYDSFLQGKQVKQVLEIGCGSGNDTGYLVEQGFQVTATDFSEEALSITRQAVPGAELVQHDTRHPFPFENESFDLIVAGLSLHYFSSPEMKPILEEIKRLLQVNGLLLFRVNSDQDDDALKVHPIDRIFYSLETCRSLFAEWKEISLEEVSADYYGKIKMMIEGLYERER